MSKDLEILFSIIIPTYNRAKQLKRALNCIAKQTCKNFEVIVCDDGSNDSTKHVIRNFSKKLPIKYLWGENWGGPAKPRNIGIRNAIGDWICFLDSDDWWYPEKLETIKNNIINYDVDVIYHDLDIYTPRGKKKWIKQKGRKYKKPVFLSLLYSGRGPANSSAVVRKEIINSVGGLTEDKNIVAVEDFDLWIKISRVTEKFLYIKQSLGAYWEDDSNISKSSDKIIENIERVYKKYEYLLSYEEKIETRKMLCYVNGKIKLRMGNENEALHSYKISMKSIQIQIKIKSIISIALINFRHLVKII